MSGKIPKYSLLPEERINILVGRDVTWISTFAKVLKDRYGPEALVVLGNGMREVTRQAAESALKKLNIKERDARGAIKVLSFWHDAVSGVEGKVTEYTSKRSVRIEKRCPWQKALTREICEKWFSLPGMEGLAQAVNPKLKAYHKSYLSGGDPTCEIGFELEE